MPPRSVTIHAGLRKCGSTTIQSWLRKNAVRLGTGYHVSSRDDLTRAWRQAAFAYVAKPDVAHRRDRLAREIDAAVDGFRGFDCDHLILSDENLAGNRVRARDGSTIIDWLCLVAEMTRAAMAERGMELMFVVYRRDTERFLRSAWHQAVVNNFETRSWAAWRARNALPDLGCLDDRLAGIDGLRFKVVSMEDELESGRHLGSAVLLAAGVPEDVVASLEPVSRENASLPEDKLNLIRRANVVRAGRLLRPLLGEGHVA